MSAPDLHPAGEGLDATAGEYVLGVLDAGERAAVTARLAADGRLRDEVAAWEARLTPWADVVAPVPPPPGLWSAVERALGPARDGAEGVVVVLRRRLGYWRVATGVSLALAAALALAVVVPVATRPPAPAAVAPAPMMMARLTPPGGRAPMFMAVLDPGRHELMIAPAVAEGHPGQAPELWLIPAVGKPAPLGMAGFETPVRLAMAADLGGAGRTTLAVSLEPPGGSPTGQPTGPVIATGELKPA